AREGRRLGHKKDDRGRGLRKDCSRARQISLAGRGNFVCANCGREEDRGARRIAQTANETRWQCLPDGQWQSDSRLQFWKDRGSTGAGALAERHTRCSRTRPVHRAGKAGASRKGNVGRGVERSSGKSHGIARYYLSFLGGIAWRTESPTNFSVPGFQFVSSSKKTQQPFGFRRSISSTVVDTRGRDPSSCARYHKRE